MSDITTYIHYGVTVITTLSTVVLGYLAYRDKKIDISNELHHKISELEISQAVIIERLNNNIEFTSKMDLIMTKGNRNEM